MVQQRMSFSRGIVRGLANVAAQGKERKTITIIRDQFPCDDYTNVTPKIISHVGKSLHNRPHHPLCLLKQRIVQHFYTSFVGRTGNPLFSFYDSLSPIVTVYQNFDSLLIPKDHVSRRKSDCYYINRTHLLRAHMTAHQSELIKMGLNNFLMFGDVYRRDEIDSTHYPVFHQADAVRLCNKDQLENMVGTDVRIFEKNPCKDMDDRQGVHTLDASKIMEHHLKSTLLSLSQSLFGKDIPYRWVDVYFPFTHPSWELEIQFNGKWMEILGSGIMRHDILKAVGADNNIGWAFGLGLERIAMLLFEIPDIRLFWSTDTGFLSQFVTDDPTKNIKYKPVSIYPQCINDMSFWLPDDRPFEENDFYELARDIGGDLIEQVKLVDEFRHPKTGKTSHCYRIIYRHLERTLNQEEVNKIHKSIGEAATSALGIRIR